MLSVHLETPPRYDAWADAGPKETFLTNTSETPQQVALAWLSLVDEGRASDSWADAASYFRGAVTEVQWTASSTAVRRPLGCVVSREVQSERLASELPGAPDGEYVVIQFATSFERKRSAVETVTPMRDTDGRWRVAGYFIR